MFDENQLSALPQSDISVPSSISDTRFVLNANELGIQADKAGLLSYFENNKNSIREYFDQHGAIYFRGFKLNGAEDFQDAMTALGFDLMASNLAGAAPRPCIRDKVFLSTDAPKPFIIGYHTEFVYQRKRPGMIAFYCEIAPELHGETPFINCAGLYDDLEPSLRDKLERNGVTYHRRFYGKKSKFNFRKTWMDCFNTEDKSVVEAYFESEGASYKWLEDNTLLTELSMQAVVTDPITKKKMLAVTMFNGETFAYNFEHFRDRYSWLTRKVLSWFVHRETRPENRFLYITLGDGTPFTQQESESIQKACWRQAIIAKWRVGDFVLLNNKRWGHARLNVRDERKIIVAMGDQYDLREWQANVAVA